MKLIYNIKLGSTIQIQPTIIYGLNNNNILWQYCSTNIGNCCIEISWYMINVNDLNQCIYMYIIQVKSLDYYINTIKDEFIRI